MTFLKKHIRLFAFFLLFLVFIGQYLFLGVRTAIDTAQFERFSEEVYPLYPLIMYLFRTIFGTDLGYKLLGFFQNVLLVFSIFSLVDYLRRTYQLSAVSYLFSIIVSMLTFLVQLWFTRAGIISSNTLFSEALSIPLYLFFFRYALETLLVKKGKPFLLSCLFALCLILTRGQLYWVLVVVFFIGLRLAVFSRGKAFLSAILACAVIVGCVQGSRYIQTINVRDEQIKSPLGFFLLTTAMYCSEEENALLFQKNTGERMLFDTAREWIDDPENLAAFSYETGSLSNRHLKFEKKYDPLKKVLRTTYASLASQGISVAVVEMTATLVFSNLGAFLLHCAENALAAMIRTVAILKPGINLLAGLFYCFMLLYSVFLWKTKRLQKEWQFALLGMLCVLLNALMMAPGVFALSRYVFYNMPIMYLAAIVLVRTLIPVRLKKLLYE